MHLIRSLVVASLIAVFQSANCAAPVKTSAVKTIATVAELEALLKASGDRLLVFDLYADWCMPCKTLSPMLEQIAVEAKDRATVYKINVDRSPDLAAAFGVQGIPLVVFVRNSRAVYALTGLQRKSVYLRVIDEQSGAEAKTDRADGELVAGVRVIRLNPATSVGRLHVYRGDHVRLVIDTVPFPYTMSIPKLNVLAKGEVGKPFQTEFKAESLGVFSIFCNGKCPTGDGAQYGQIVVMQYEALSGVAYREVTADTARTLIARVKPLILDVRTPAEYYEGHLEGATLIPVQQLAERWTELAQHRDKEILIYCRSGNRSTVAAKILEDQGFTRLYNMRGGVKAWERAGGKTVTEGAPGRKL